MASPQFSRHTRPLAPSTYASAAQKIRRLADRIEAGQLAESPREKAQLSGAISGLTRLARTLFLRHNGLPHDDQ
jgi:hypothetical protein